MTYQKQLATMLLQVRLLDLRGLTIIGFRCKELRGCAGVGKSTNPCVMESSNFVQ